MDNTNHHKGEIYIINYRYMQSTLLQQLFSFLSSPSLTYDKRCSNSLATTLEPFVKIFCHPLQSTLHNLVIIIWLIGLLLWQKNRNGSGLDTPGVSAKVRNRAPWKGTKYFWYVFYFEWCVFTEYLVISTNKTFLLEFKDVSK